METHINFVFPLTSFDLIHRHRSLTTLFHYIQPLLDGVIKRIYIFNISTNYLKSQWIKQDCEGDEEHGDEREKAHQGVDPGVFSDARLQYSIDESWGGDSAEDGLHEQAAKDGETHEVQSILVLLIVRGESCFKLAKKDKKGSCVEY